jgi:ABC-2 type transport system ATP-binding protein
MWCSKQFDPNDGKFLACMHTFRHHPARESLLEFAIGRPGGCRLFDMKRRLSIARAMMHHPRVVLLDEPTVGLDAHARRRVWDLIRRLRDDGCTIVLTTHYIEEAEMLADRVVIIDRGRVIADGAPKGLIADAGAMAVDYAGPGGTETSFFESHQQAADFVRTLDARATIRRVNLEDVFIRLTGRRVNSNEQEGGAAHATGHGRHSA